MNTYKYIFGPVPSRRLGRSLGIDLLPLKTCSFDCVFCQLGRTPATTLQRKEYVSTQSVLQELRDWLASDGAADFITLSGSGEPTLHRSFEQILGFVRENSSISTALLSNGSMFAWPEIRKQAQEADLVKVSLSAWDQKSLERINRPHPEIEFTKLIQGLREFSQEYQGSLMLEVFLIAGINDDPASVCKIAEKINDLNIQEVQLNTIVRPPAEKDIFPVSRENLERLAQEFTPAVEIFTDYKSDPNKQISSSLNSILALLQRRPCTIQEIIEVSGRSRSEVECSIQELIQRKKIKMFEQNNKQYYTAA